jgi:23S rRNA pseudouridine1911/1915/1917 synthase
MNKTTKTERLDKILTQQTRQSRSQIQKMIKNGFVSINNRVVTQPHFFVSASDSIKTESDSKLKNEEIKKDIPRLKIFYEDNDVIAFEKPAGIIVHEAANKNETTVVDALIKYCPTIKKAGDDSRRPGIVHRLDKLASGVMVAAKNQKTFEFLKKQFAEKKIKKEYLVLVYGTPGKNSGTISFKLARSKNKGRIVARPTLSDDGKEAITHFEVLQKFKTVTLLRVIIETGRTHQIRAHFRAINLPVVGDPIYKKNYMKNIKPLPLPRLFLHAHQLTIPLPNGGLKTFVSPLPQELEKILETLPKK